MSLASISPVLLILWIRPHLLERQIVHLRQSRVPKVYVSIDGPREDNSTDVELIERTISEVHRLIDWDCEIYIRKNEKNQGGCKHAVINAINWVFSIEKAAIILEDDCIPTSKFLDFASKMLLFGATCSTVWCKRSALLHTNQIFASHINLFDARS